jgi:hypothetical protein
MLKSFFKVWVLLLFFGLSICKTLHSQSLDTLRYTGTFTNTPVIEVFSKIESDLNIHFYYDPTWIPVDKTITATFKRHYLTDVVDDILTSSDLTYVIIGNSIILMPRSEIDQVIGQSNKFTFIGEEKYDVIVIGEPKLIGKFKKVTIEGTITDGATGETLIGATLKVEGTNNYAVSGNTGNFHLTVDAGVYELEVSSMGYETKKIKIKAISPGTLNIELFEKSHQISEVVVTSFRTQNNIRNNQMSVVEMDAKAIKQLPMMVGEKDIIKAFTMMPGVKTVGEFGSGINVRGGGEDQNLYLLEGAPIFNTSHALGLMSVINPDAVNGITLYKGHIPAEYGERVSSVMDIRLHDYSCKEFGVKGGIGIFSSRLQIEGPLFKEKVTLKIGARTSYSDYLLSKMPDYYLSNSSISFFDINGTMNFQLKNNPISVFGYFSNDYFRYAQNFSYKYGNKLGSLSWSHLFNADLSSNLTLAYSNYNNLNKTFSDPRKASSTESDLKYYSGKFKISYSGLINHDIQGGVQTIKYEIQPGEINPYNVDSTYKSIVKTYRSDKESAYDFTVFINDAYEINKKFTLQAGLRFSFYYYMKPGKGYTYGANGPISIFNFSDSTTYGKGDVISKYQGFEPRVSVKYMLSNYSSIKASYNRNIQNLILLSRTSITTPEDVWKLADKYIKPMIVNQFAIGYYRNFLGEMFESSVEVYYKSLTHMIEFKSGSNTDLSVPVETKLIDTKGENYGIEFLIKKVMGDLTGSFTYTYSRAFKQSHGKYTEDKINNNHVFASAYDKPHDLNLALNYSVNHRLRVGANFVYNSGRPFTRPEYVYTSQNQEVVRYSDRNKYRLEPYHRLDLSISFDENLRKNREWKGSWTFSVLNVYARKNAYSVTYRRDEPNEANNYQVFNLYKIYLIGKPFPTITYNFMF